MRKLEMTDEEIARSYKNAISKRKQVGILAELNGCDKKEILEHLAAVGIKMGWPKPKAKEDEPEAVAVVKTLEEVKNDSFEVIERQDPEDDCSLLQINADESTAAAEPVPVPEEEKEPEKQPEPVPQVVIDLAIQEKNKIEGFIRELERDLRKYYTEQDQLDRWLKEVMA